MNLKIPIILSFLILIFLFGCASEKETEICPAVCVPMWSFDSNANECSFVECGSGCGPNEDTTFGTEDGCKKKIISGATAEGSKSEEVLDVNSCDDGDVCTEDTLDAETGKCTYERSESCCGDGFCDFSERCNEESHKTVCPSDCPRTCPGVLTVSEFTCEGECDTLEDETFSITGNSLLQTRPENIGELPLSSISSSFSCRSAESGSIYYNEKSEKDVYNGVSIKDYFEGNKESVVLKGEPFPDTSIVYNLEITGSPEKTRSFICTIRFTGSAVYYSREITLNFETEAL